MLYNLMLSYFKNGKACSHAAAIAFKIEFAVRAGLVESAPTDELCKWNVTSKKNVSKVCLCKSGKGSIMIYSDNLYESEKHRIKIKYCKGIGGAVAQSI